MCTGLSEDLETLSDARKTAIIDRELLRLNMDIVALQETRLPSTGSLKEANYTFFWQGLEPTERRIYGVGFAVRNSLLSILHRNSFQTDREDPLTPSPLLYWEHQHHLCLCSNPQRHT